MSLFADATFEYEIFRLMRLQPRLWLKPKRGS